MKHLFYLSILLTFGLTAKAQNIEIDAGFFGVKLSELRTVSANAIVAEYLKSNSLPKKYKIQIKDLAINAIKKSGTITTLSMIAVGPVINDSGVPDVCSLDLAIAAENEELKSITALNVECSPYD